VIRRALILAAAAIAVAAAPALAEPGDLDPTFGDRGRVDSHAILQGFGGEDETLDGVSILPDGRIVLMGTERCAMACRDKVVTRLTASGRPDRSLSVTPEPGVFTVRVANDPEILDDWVYSVALRPDGGLLVTHATEIRPVAPDGSPEPPVATWGPLVIGTVARSAYARLDRSIVRLTPSLTVDGSFAPLALPDGVGKYPAPVVAAHGALHVAGVGPGALALWRAGLDGGAPTFGVMPLPPTDRLRTYRPDQTLVGPRGQTVVVASAFTPTSATLLAGFTADGAPDPAFGRGGIVRVAGLGEAAFDARGRIVVATMAPGGKRKRIVVRRYGSSGSADRAFGTRGLVLGTGYSDRAHVAIDRRGRIVVAAPFGRWNGARPSVTLFRLGG
jgi:uncharacterized delta-60 repeat protein